MIYDSAALEDNYISAHNEENSAVESHSAAGESSSACLGQETRLTVKEKGVGDAITCN